MAVAFPLWSARAAGGRLALVIGNGRYEAQPPLGNAVRDARAVAEALERIGFAVERREDLGRRATVDALLDFADRARQAEVVLVYYAGHGVQVAGRDGAAENYLVPVDARLSDARKVADEAVPLSRLLDELAGNAALLVLLDACRDNPVAARMPGQGTRASVGRGLARVPEGGVAQGSLIAFAAAPGQVAYDGQGQLNGPFAAALVRNLPVRGVDVGLMLQRVALDVEHVTKGSQQPEVVNRLRLREPLYLAGPEYPAQAHAPMQAQPPASPSRPPAGPAPAHECDRLAQPPKSFMGRSPTYAEGAATDKLDVAVAWAACQQAMAEYPAEARFVAYAGRVADRAGNLPEAMRLYRLAFERGFVGAQNSLAAMYLEGRGVARDDREAVHLLRFAAERGDTTAQSNLAAMYFEGRGVARDEREAVRLFRLAAEQGDATAQTGLGAAYMQGRGVARDEREGVRLLRLAAEQGFTTAQAVLGAAYMQGRGVARDEREAVRLFRLAAEQGDALAQNNLGDAFMYGHGVPRDDREAIRFFRLAADQGNMLAQTNLGVMHLEGLGVARDEREAVRLFRLAADQGFTTAQVALGVMYKGGRGVARDEREAVRLFRLAAERDDAVAQTHLGIMYFEGRGVARDEREAVRLLRLAAEQGNATAQTGLGAMYFKGRGVARDEREGVRLLRLAAEQGHAEAKTILRKLGR